MRTVYHCFLAHCMWQASELLNGYLLQA